MPPLTHVHTHAPTQTPPPSLTLPPGRPRYEFLTRNGLHAVMSAGAHKGRVLLAGAAAPSKEAWAAYGQSLSRSTASFRIRDGYTVL